ncbi:MAG: PIG-L family deacetylase [Lacunisphaera sp.]|nr:PIG-L family deacetylase [Lacunisphaera sp.]
MTPRILFGSSLSLLCSLAAWAPLIAAADSPSPAAPALGSAEGIRQDLRSFATLGTVLHVGAHPDDENTQLITYLSLGRGYRAAYLSLTRGDGGQNELGRDFDEKLGVARTQELLAARRFDHGRQFFTRAIDFGYSKTPEETLRFWDSGQVLGDVVRVIRQFRPDVIVTRFPVPPGSGGHGHHTASAILAVEAFKLAGDPQAYPEQLAQGLTVWQPKRVVWNGWGSRGPGGPSLLTGPSIPLDIAGTDPVTGESFGTIANKSRGMHKTQGLGQFSGRTADGPSVQTFIALAGEPATTDLMDGVDLTWARYPGGAGIGRLAAEALAQFKTDDPVASVPALFALRRQLAALPADPLIADKRAQLERIIQACLGLTVETRIAHAEIVPGEPFALTVDYRVAAKNADVSHAESRSPVLKLVPTKPGQLTGVLPLDFSLSQPYWLQADGAAGISRVDDPRLIGQPENPPALPIEHIFRVGAEQVVVADEPVQLIAGAAGTPARRPVTVIPPVSLAFSSEIFLVAPGTSRSVTVEVAAARANAHGTVGLEVPDGWTVAPATQNFRLTAVGERTTLTFTLTSPLPGDRPGQTPAGQQAGTVLPSAGRVTAVATVDGRRYSNQRQEINYAHLPFQLLQPPARARVASFALATRGRNVGYLPGAGDAVAECLEQMGYDVRRLTGADLTPEKLAGLDAVVIGVRAFNERADLKDAFPGLLAWVEAGGTVVAQYNRPNGLLAPVLGPYALSIEGPAPRLRVTDETAPVTFLAPDHPALNTPNQITAADFEGWVQERGAYFPGKWDEARYTAILAMNDPGEAPLTSSILIAKHGRGQYVYTGIGFFRQLPAGVPGAYRLFANLVSLGK